MKNVYSIASIASLLFLASSTAFALSPECKALTFAVRAKPGVGGTSDNTFLRWIKYPNNSRLYHIGSGSIKKNAGPQGFSSNTAEHSVRPPNGANDWLIHEYDTCTIERDARGELRRVSISFHASYRGSDANAPDQPAYVTLAATTFRRASQGLPADAEARYFQNLSYTVTVTSNGSTPIAGNARFNSVTDGGTDNGSGFIWLNQPLNWPYE